MISNIDFKNKNVVIAGLDKSGVAAVKYFSSLEAKVKVADLRNRNELQKAVELIAEYNVKIDNKYHPIKETNKSKYSSL